MKEFERRQKLHAERTAEENAIRYAERQRAIIELCEAAEANNFKDSRGGTYSPKEVKAKKRRAEVQLGYTLRSKVYKRAMAKLQ